MRTKKAIEEEIAKVVRDFEIVKKKYDEADSAYKNAQYEYGLAIMKAQTNSWFMREAQRWASESSRQTALKGSLNKEAMKLVDLQEKLREELETWQNRYDTEAEFRAEVDLETENNYNSLLDKMKSSSSADDFKTLTNQFRDMIPYKDSERLADECQKAEKKARYPLLIQEMNIVSTADEYLNLAKRFRDMIPYENSEKLATECEEAAKKARYDLLLQQMFAASTADEYLNLEKQFRRMIPYENSEELAEECYNHYKIIIDIIEGVERRKKIREIIWQVAAWVLAAVALIMLISFLRILGKKQSGCSYGCLWILGLAFTIIPFLGIFFEDLFFSLNRKIVKNIILLTVSVLMSVLLISEGNVYAIAYGFCNMISCIIAIVFPKKIESEAK